MSEPNAEAANARTANILTWLTLAQLLLFFVPAAFPDCDAINAAKHFGEPEPATAFTVLGVVCFFALPISGAAALLTRSGSLLIPAVLWLVLSWPILFLSVNMLSTSMCAG